MSDPVIVAQALSVVYGRKAVLDKIELQVEAGEVYAVLGRNGVGKSSLVRCLLGLQAPTRGTAALFGKPSWQHRAELMARLGVVPEEPDAPPDWTPQALAQLCSQLYPRWESQPFAARLQRFEVPQNVPMEQLSRGQKTLVMLALALAPAPALLILDDPTLGLDAVARRMVLEELVDELAERGTTVLITTHDLAGVEGLASRVAFLDRGRLCIDEPLETLKGRFRRLTYHRAAAGGDAKRPNGLSQPLSGEAIEQLITSFLPLKITDRGRWVEAVVSNFEPGAVTRLGSALQADQPLSLEEIFIAVTGDGLALQPEVVR